MQTLSSSSSLSPSPQTTHTFLLNHNSAVVMTQHHIHTDNVQVPMSQDLSQNITSLITHAPHAYDMQQHISEVDPPDPSRGPLVSHIKPITGVEMPHQLISGQFITPSIPLSGHSGLIGHTSTMPLGVPSSQSPSYVGISHMQQAFVTMETNIVGTRLELASHVQDERVLGTMVDHQPEVGPNPRQISNFNFGNFGDKEGNIFSPANESGDSPTTSADPASPKSPRNSTQYQSPRAANLPAAQQDQNESGALTETNPPVKRGRGRPRKHPLPETKLLSSNRGTRCKTGCITCRRRKKKCDETKPRCENCQKNAVVCEGYNDPKKWAPGPKGTYEDDDDVDLPPILLGCTSLEDRVLLHHYYTRLSSRLTVEMEMHNAFVMQVMPMAQHNELLMHCVLYLSSVHLDLDSPAGEKAVSEQPGVTKESMLQRSEYHLTQIKTGFSEGKRCCNPDSPFAQDEIHNTDARLLQSICMLVAARALGARDGSHRQYLEEFLTLEQHYQAPMADALSFVTEFFQYHLFADMLLSHPERESLTHSFCRQPLAPALSQQLLIGIGDGLLSQLIAINDIRVLIRQQVMAGLTELSNTYTTVWESYKIESALNSWRPKLTAGDSRILVAKIYKTALWVHLNRSLEPPVPSKEVMHLINEQQGKLNPGTVSPITIGSDFVQPIFQSPMTAMLTSNTSYSSGFFSPAESRRSSSVGDEISIPATPGSVVDTPMAHGTSIGEESDTQRADAMHQYASSRVPVIQTAGIMTNPVAIPRRSFHHQTRTIQTVDKALELLAKVKPSDPSRTLLLMPCLLIGVAAIRKDQQGKVLAALKLVKGYTGMRNCDLVVELLEEVWRLMEKEDWWSVWDWQSVAVKMKLDFVPA